MSKEKTMVDVADNAVDKIANAVEAAVQKAGPIAEQGWDVMVRGVQLEAIAEVGIAAFFAILICAGCGLTYSQRHFAAARDAQDWRFCIPLVVTVLMSTIWLIAVLAQAPGWTRDIMLPEYTAAQNLLGFVR